MTYEVIITSRAEQEAQANRNWWATNRSAEQAARWYEEFAKSVLSLEEKPDRCAPAPESDQFPYEVRQLNRHRPQSNFIDSFTLSAQMKC